MNSLIRQITLNDNLIIPEIGFGTYKLNGSDGVKSIIQAIHNGYRLLDSAFNYENEGAVGKAVRECGVPRDQLRITSKLPGRHHEYDQALKTIEESLFRAGLDYYDLYLIHWPNPLTGKYIEAWKALIEAKKRGMIRSIGVCNFLPEYLEKLVQETGVVPSINQIELHPYFSQEEQRKYDKRLGIITEAWSPLGRASAILQDPVLIDIANQHQKSVGQIILRWHIQIGVVPIPKATSDERQKENINIFDFELSDYNMNRINGLTKVNGRRKDQDPSHYEEF